MSKQTLFISDLHLEANQPTITAKFVNFLANCAAEVEAIYILGDLFEVWIGDDDRSIFHQQIIDALHAAKQKGIQLYFLAGNRDFLIGKKFAKQTGCHLITEETVIHLYGAKVLLMHGDTLCTRDIAYLTARKKWRRNWILTLFLWLPLSTRRKIATRMRNQSKAHTTTTHAEIMDVTLEEVASVLEKHQAKYLIHGHTHRPAMHEFQLKDGSSAYRIVLGAWHDKGNALIWHADGRKELVYF